MKSDPFELVFKALLKSDPFELYLNFSEPQPVLLKAELVSFSNLEALISDTETLELLKTEGLQLRLQLPGGVTGDSSVAFADVKLDSGALTNVDLAGLSSYLLAVESGDSSKQPAGTQTVLAEPLLLFHENLPAKLWTEWLLALPRIEAGVVKPTPEREEEPALTGTEAGTAAGGGSNMEEGCSPQVSSEDERTIVGRSHVNMLGLFEKASLEINALVVKTKDADRLPFGSEEVLKSCGYKPMSLRIKYALHVPLPIAVEEEE